VRLEVINASIRIAGLTAVALVPADAHPTVRWARLVAIEFAEWSLSAVDCRCERGGGLLMRGEPEPETCRLFVAVPAAVIYAGASGTPACAGSVGGSTTSGRAPGPPRKCLIP
jgi:hypothetical protein